MSKSYIAFRIASFIVVILIVWGAIWLNHQIDLLWEHLRNQ